MFFGPKHNLIMPGRAANMSDGWETRRRRGPGNDWVIVKLGCEGVVRRIEIDTAHFKGNYPDTASIDVAPDGPEILPRTKLQADTRHAFIDELRDVGPVRELRLNVVPDGGVSRLRVHGTATERGRQEAVVRRVNTLVPSRAEAELRRCCASTEWVRRLLDARPFADWNALTGVADRIWSTLDRDDWLEAFGAHPRIGDKKGSRWSAREQSTTAEASEETMRRLAEANAEYERRFGHTYIVCATGKTSAEMLAILEARMKNDAATELREAAEQQRQITELRLHRWLESE